MAMVAKASGMVARERVADFGCFLIGWDRMEMSGVPSIGHLKHGRGAPFKENIGRL
jgi:hypothetical protein